MLTDFLARLSPNIWHRVMAWLGITDGVHEWLEGMCPCGS